MFENDVCVCVFFFPTLLFCRSETRVRHQHGMFPYRFSTEKLNGKNGPLHVMPLLASDQWGKGSGPVVLLRFGHDARCIGFIVHATLFIKT